MAERNEPDNFSKDEFETLIQQFELDIKNANKLFLEPNSFIKVIEYYEDKLENEKALEASELAQSHYPFSAIFKIKTARFLNELGETNEAYELLETAKMFDATEVEYYLLKSEILANLGKFSEAIIIIKEGLQFADKYEKFDLLLNLSDIYESNLNYQGMFNALSKAAFICPKDFEVSDRLGFCVEELNCYAEAIELYNKLLDTEPYAQHIWYNLGKTYGALKLYEKAIEAYDFALVINENYYEAQFEKAEAFYDLQQYQSALSNYLEAMKLREPDEEIYYCLGFTYYHLDNHEFAITHFKSSINIDSSYQDAYFQLGKIKEEHGYIDTAIHYYQKAFSLEQDNKEYAFALAEINLKTENYEVASQHYINYLTKDPSKDSIWLKLANCYAQMELFEEALQVIDLALNAIKDSANLYAISGIYNWKVGNQQLAYGLFREALMLDQIVINLVFKELPFLRDNIVIQDLII